MSNAHSAFAVLEIDFEVVSETAPCAERRGVVGGSPKRARELWGFHGCGRKFKSCHSDQISTVILIE